MFSQAGTQPKAPFRADQSSPLHILLDMEGCSHSKRPAQPSIRGLCRQRCHLCSVKWPPPWFFRSRCHQCNDTGPIPSHKSKIRLCSVKRLPDVVFRHSSQKIRLCSSKRHPPGTGRDPIQKKIRLCSVTRHSRCTGSVSGRGAQAMGRPRSLEHGISTLHWRPICDPP